MAYVGKGSAQSLPPAGGDSDCLVPATKRRMSRQVCIVAVSPLLRKKLPQLAFLRESCRPPEAVRYSPVS
jgi:hypothetical protein